MFAVISYLLDKEAVKGIPKIQGIKIRDLARFIESQGFEFKKQSGSHLIYSKPGHPTNVVIPPSLQRGTINSITRQMGLSLPAFSSLFARFMGYQGFEDEGEISTVSTPPSRSDYGRHGIAFGR